MQIIEAIDAAPLNRGLRGADWLASKDNMPVTFANGDIALFDGDGSDIYQVHVLFVSRGREAIDRVRETFRTMFEDHGAVLIFGMVPDFRRDVKLLARWTGCRFAGLRNTVAGMCEMFVITRQMWESAR